MPRKAKKQKTQDDEGDAEKLFHEIETWDSKKVEEALRKLLQIIIIERTGKDSSNLIKKLYLLVLKSPYSNWKKSSLTVRLTTPRNVILKTLRDYSNYVTLDYKDVVFEFKKIFENSPLLKEYSLIHAALCTSFLLVQSGKPEIVEVFPFVEKIAYECLKIVSEKQEEPISEQGGIIGELLRVCLDIFCSIWLNDLYSAYFVSKSAVIDICMKSLSLEITKWKPDQVRRRVEILSPSMIWLEVREESISTIHRIISKDKEIDIELRRKLILLVMKVMKDTPIIIDETEHFRRDSVSLMQDLVVDSPEVSQEFQVKIIDECIIPVLEPIDGEIPENEINITKEFAIHFFKKLVGEPKVPEIGKQILSDPKSSVNRKYAALEFIKELNDEELFQKYVVPLLDDEHSLLKIEACRILQYAKFTSTDVKPIFNTILQLMKDKDVEVQRQAFASTLSFLSSINPEPEFTSNFFKGNLETMLKLLFGTRDEELQLMLETLGVCMIQIGREVVPYMDKILDATMKLFRRNFDPQETLTMTPKELRQRERIVTEVLQFYSNIFESFKRFPDICESMYDVLEVNMFPLIIITEDEEDYLEEFFRLLVAISDCKLLRSDMWRFLHEILSHYDVHADDFWGDIGALIINYVKYDVETFLEKNFVERAWWIVNEALSTMNVPQYQIYSLIMDSLFTQSYLFRESVNKKQKVMSVQQTKSMKYLKSKVLPKYFKQITAMIPEAPKPFPQKTLILGVYNCFFYSPQSCVALAYDMSDEALDEIIQSLGTFIKVVTKRAEIFGLIGMISVMKQLPRNFQEKSAKIFPYLVTAMHNFEVKVKQIKENESKSEDKPAFSITPKVDPRDESYEFMDTDDSDEDDEGGEGVKGSHLVTSDVVISLQHDFYPDIYSPNFKLMFGDTVQRDSSLMEQMKAFLNAQEKEYLDQFIEAAQAIRVPSLMIKVIKFICEDLERFASELHRIPPEIIEEIQAHIATNKIKIPDHISILKEKS